MNNHKRMSKKCAEVNSVIAGQNLYCGVLRFVAAQYDKKTGFITVEQLHDGKRVVLPTFGLRNGRGEPITF